MYVYMRICVYISMNACLHLFKRGYSPLSSFSFFLNELSDTYLGIYTPVLCISETTILRTYIYIYRSDARPC